MVMGSCPKCDAMKTFSLQSRQNTEDRSPAPFNSAISHASECAI